MTVWGIQTPPSSDQHAACVSLKVAAPLVATPRSACAATTRGYTPCPEDGYRWTPDYWHYGVAGYWSPHVGFHGGINYGFGYSGVEFVGGRWERGHFPQISSNKPALRGRVANDDPEPLNMNHAPVVP